jgi:Nif-specific regulatory protein
MPASPTVPLPVIMPAVTPLTGPVPAEAKCASAGTGGVTQSAGLSEQQRLVEAMEKCGWAQAKAARLLNMTPRQIGYALRKHGIPIKKL